MSSIVQLKRSALSGKVPGTGSLNLGELALNTYDGKIFFRRSGSTDTIQEVVTTNVLNTGSVTITGTLTAGSIVGSISASNGVVSGSSQIVGILSSLNSYTSSYATTGSNQFTADQNITGSLRATLTGSFGSLKVNDTLTINHGEAIISGSALVTSDLTILGQVNARQFNISVISSSVLFESGSSRFGNTLDDTHSFTGSVNITGSFLLNGSPVGGGTTTGSFTGSFTGDGSGLRGVVSDDIPRDGWDYNANSSASISDFNSVSDKYYIDFEQSQSTAVGTPIGFKGFLTNVSGSTQILPTLNSIDFIVGDNLVASIGVGGIQATIPAGTISGSSQLTSSYDTRYVLSGSITQTTWDNIASKPSGIISGSSQLTSSVLATTGSNTFRGTQTLSGSVIPAIDNTYDLGSATYQWRDIYVSSGSLYIDGTKVLGSTGNELQITTDVGQSIKILEAGSDSIILQSADGNIELKSSGGGNLLFDPTTGLIDVRGTLQIQDGNKITSSGGNTIVFGNNIVVSGSIESTGNINGINLTTFSSSIASTFSNQNSATSSYETKGRGLVSGSSQITFSGINSLPTLVSGSSQITYANISSIPSGIVSSSAQILNASGLVSGSSQIIYADISSIPSGIVSGSSQITLSSTTGFSTYSTSVDSRITTEKGRVDAILLAADADKDTFTEIVALINSVDTSNDSTFASFYTASVNRLNNLETTSGSVNISISNINTQTGSSNTRLTALEASASTALSTNGTQATSITNLNTTTASLNTSVTNLNTATSSYETKGRGIVSGSSQITYANISSISVGIVSGSSQITFSGITSKPTTISGYGITDALNNATGSEQTIGFRYGQINNSDKTIKFDPRWNESTYDADLGTLHIYSTTAAGANYGRTGIALYHGSAYQYLTTKAATTGLFVNNSLIATAGSSPTFVSVTGTITESGSGDSNAPFKFSADYSGWMSHVAGTPGSNNGWGLFWAGNSGAQYGTNGTGGPGNIWSNSANPNEYVFVGNGSTNMSINGNTGNVWIGGELRVKGDVLPNTNNTHNLGSASLRWANLYTNDLHLSNEGKVGGNEVDGTTGNWTIQEGQEHLYIINNKTGKKFKFSLEEIQ